MTETELLRQLTLTPEEAARILRMSRNGIYAAIARGEIPSVRIGRCIRVPSAWLRRETLGGEIA